jgi:hypothetical protein
MGIPICLENGFTQPSLAEFAQGRNEICTPARLMAYGLPPTAHGSPPREGCEWAEKPGAAEPVPGRRRATPRAGAVLSDACDTAVAQCGTTRSARRFGRRRLPARALRPARQTDRRAPRSYGTNIGPVCRFIKAFRVNLGDFLGGLTARGSDQGRALTLDIAARRSGAGGRGSDECRSLTVAVRIKRRVAFLPIAYCLLPVASNYGRDARATRPSTARRTGRCRMHRSFHPR